MIIKCPQNGQYHVRRDVILTSGMAVINNSIMVTIIQNIGNSSCINITITENDDLEMTVSENHD